MSEASGRHDMIAIIGTGKMGEALLSGLLRAGRPAREVAAVTRRPERGTELAARYGVPVISSEEAAKNADTLVVAVKPQDMARALGEIAGLVRRGSAKNARDHHRAAARPILDYHCHLSARDIAENRRFANLFAYEGADSVLKCAFRLAGRSERPVTDKVTTHEDGFGRNHP